jgi:hypothetical protein
MRVQEVVMSEWPVGKEEAPMSFEQTEQEASWLAPQCMCPLSGEVSQSRDPEPRSVTLGFIAWMRTVAVFPRNRHRH